MGSGVITKAALGEVGLLEEVGIVDALRLVIFETTSILRALNAFVIGVGDLAAFGRRED